jgi:LysM repeat protein
VPKTYTVKSGDTLSTIARRLLGSATQADGLARFNGITNPNAILIGQVIEIPSTREFSSPKPEPVGIGGGTAAARAPSLSRPRGYDEIVAAFGDVKANLDADGNLSQDWVRQNIARARLPYPLIVSWNHAQQVVSFACHRKLVNIFEHTFEAICDAGLQQKLQYFGGCFNFRQKRTSSKLSAHSWGIAIDLNPETNPLGAAGNMDSRVITIFEQFNFKWGGEFRGGKDPMHFQYCDGY